MRVVIAAILLGLSASSSFALSISWEIERGFRFFKYNSDYELHRLAFRDFQEKKGSAPTIVELDARVSDPEWWGTKVGPKTAAWYGHKEDVKPVNLVREWRKSEFPERPRGYLELADKIEDQKLPGAWEYHPARLGWASLLFPAHQSPNELEDAELDNLQSASKVAVCWDRSKQRHSNCGGFDAYINPVGHSAILRALSAPDTRILDGRCTWKILDQPAAKFVLPAGATDSSVTLNCSDNVAVFVPTKKVVQIRLIHNGSEADSTISIHDALIVGIGDSFASGEGNPDVPVKLRWTNDPELDWAADGDRIIDDVTHGPLRKSSGDYFAAQWIDRSCHRSAYSYQLRSALHLGLSDPTRAITFLSYACSGAEVNEGLFQPYMGPEKTSSKNSKQPYEKTQLALLLSELCSNYAVNGMVRSAPFKDSEENTFIDNKTYRLGGAIDNSSYKCAGSDAGKGFKRPIDLLYVSVGGNDLGFSRWIIATLASEKFPTAFVPILKEDGAPECVGHQDSCAQTRARWKRFNARYALLRNFIDDRLEFADRGLTPVLFMTYPFPVMDQNGDYCPDGNAGSTVWSRSGLNLCVKQVQSGLPILKTISEFVDQRLNGSIEKLVGDKDDSGALRPKWIAIKDYRSSFEKRGFCASKAKDEPAVGCKTGRQAESLVKKTKRIVGVNVQETLQYPIGLGNGDTNFLPFEPSFDYQPYRHRTRLARTMNEVQFVINQLNGPQQVAKAAGILSLKDSAVFGAFHPTAEGHAHFAEGFYVKSKEILSKPLQ